MSTWLKDAIERTLRTFVQGFLAVVTVDAATTVDATTLQAVYGGLICGAYAVLTAFAAKRIGSPDSASFSG
jgi:uncharacterized protein YgbK (DUF1537 family)